MIGVGNVIFSFIVTGLCTRFAGWPGFLGSIVGHVIYYAWIQGLLFS